MNKHLSAAGAFLLLAAAAVANWAAWLGWDQQRDVQPDGHETGPYQPWQVIGFILVLTALTVAAAIRRHSFTAATAPVLGTMTALCYDWSDDDSGLWAVGATMAFVGLVTGAVIITALTHAVRRIPDLTGGGEPVAPYPGRPGS